MAIELDRTDALFQTTDWTFLSGLRDSNEDRRRRTADMLISVYWPPVYAWLRTKGIKADEAAELTQDFFFDVVLGRTLFERAEVSRGRLRDLIRTAVRHYLIDQKRKRSRRNGLPLVPLQDFHSDSLQSNAGAGQSDSPDDAFNLQWAMATLNQALEECRVRLESSGRSDYWQAFDRRVLRPSIHGCEPMPRDIVASECGLTDANHVSVVVHEVRKRLQTILLEIVSRTVEDGTDVQDEAELLQRLLS